MTEENRSKEVASPFQIFILVLCVFALTLITLDTFIHLNSEIRLILTWADTCICVVFFFDFLNSLWRSNHWWRYLITWGWVDLISSIPSVDIFRWGRAARIFRVFRLMRGSRADRILSDSILKNRATSAFFAVALILILVITISSIAILQYEGASDSKIKTAGDAIWWTFVTLTTSGYGDKTPLTVGGRIIGVGLMVSGLCLFASVSGFVASWFISPVQNKEDREIERLRKDISEFRSTLRGIRSQLPPQEADNVVESKLIKFNSSLIKQIVSGGQTGVDLAALDTAIKLGIPHGGWIPKGRLTETGRLSDKYQLQEMPTDSYPARTERNVVDSDGTLIISYGHLSSGPLYAQKMALKHNKPNLHVNLKKIDISKASVMVYDWIIKEKIGVLNVAGPRASKDPNIYQATMYLLMAVFNIQ